MLILSIFKFSGVKIHCFTNKIRVKMEKEERLRTAFQYLKSQGKAHTQKDVAQKMKATEPNVSAALKGKPKCLTDDFLMRFNVAYDSIFNLDWLIDEKGDMLADPIHQEINGDHNTQVAGNNNRVNSPVTLDKALNEIAEQRKLVSKSQEQITKSQEQIDRLLGIIEQMTKIKE